MDSSGATAGAEAGGIAEAHRRLLADGSIQFDLPTYVPPKPPAWLEPLARVLEWLGPYMKAIFWAMVIAGAAVILLLVVMELRGVAWRLPWRSRPEKAAPEETWRPDAAAARSLLSEADALARSGNYDEAVRLLLHRSIEDISGRMPQFLRPSLTARDIAAAEVLPRTPRAAFTQIARIVEAALFARQSVGLDGWREAREAYERFAFRDAWA